jgi:hypothetical protein
MVFRIVSRSAACALFGIALGAALSGCAVTYDGKDGSRHVIGLVDLQIAPAGDNKTLAGNVVAVKAVGVLASAHDGQTTFALGYASETTASIKDNAFVLGNPTQAIDEIFGEKKK